MEKYKLVGTPFDANSKLLKVVDEEFKNMQREIESAPYKTS